VPISSRDDASPAEPSAGGDGGRSAALSAAAHQRDAREAMVDALREGRTGLAEALADAAVDPAVGSIKIVKLVEAVPGVGKVVARRTLADLGLSGDLRAGLLDPAQRAGLLEALTARGAPA